MNQTKNVGLRRMASVFLAAVLLTVFAACAVAEEETAALPEIPVLEDTRPLEAEEYTFTTLSGDSVTYNRNTRRIVALSGAGDLAAFGIKPLAVLAEQVVLDSYPTFFEGVSVLAEQAVLDSYPTFFEGVSVLEYSQPFNLEEILSYEPELILVYQLMEEENIEQLEKIAPVIPLYRESFDFAERLGYIGEIFGLEEQAQALIDYAAQLQESALTAISDLGLSDKTVSVFYYMDGVSIPPSEYWYFNKILYDYLGMAYTQAAQDFLSDPNNGPFTPISNELLANYEGDLVLYADIMGTGEIPEALSTNPGWQNLAAVKEDRIGVLDAVLYAEKDVLYLRAQYEGILSALEKAMGA